MLKIFSWYVFSALIITFFHQISGSQSNNLHPVILIPGDGGSQINARLNKTTYVHYVCRTNTNYFFNLWLNIELLVPVVIDCWVDNMKLTYNNVTRKTTNTEGVETEIPGFGNSSVVEYIDPSKVSPGAYFKYLADALVAIGYVRDVSIRGAPYDFRKGPNENLEFFSNLIKLIKETYEANGNKSVVLIAHSMGGPMAQLMLQNVSQQWKDKYIRALIGLNGAWGGSVKALKVFLVGDNLGAFILKESIVKEMQITFPSLAWMMPSYWLWKENEVLVQTDKKNYTVNNFRDFFLDIDYEVGWEMYKDVLPFRNQFKAPGVEVHCLHGYGVDTTERLIYKKKEFPYNYPTLMKGPGDGTVNQRSLEACIHWEISQKQKIYHQAFSKVDHMAILRNSNVLNYVTHILIEISKTKKKFKSNRHSK